MSKRKLLSLSQDSQKRLTKPENLDQKFVHKSLPQGMLIVHDQRTGKCWEATPLLMDHRPSRCRRQVQRV